VLLSPSEQWGKAYPGAMIGALAIQGVANPKNSPALDSQKHDLETRLRSQYASLKRSELQSLASIQPYAAYYGRFGKTYHLLLQLESVALKKKSIPRVAALVEAMFMAELSTLILTAGHDREALRGQVHVDVATGAETYVTPNGQIQTLKPGDMFLRDEEGILSCILYGPAQRARIAGETTHVLFTAYAPPGLEAEKMRDHLRALEANVFTITPGAEVADLHILVAG
jgi:DNA/RNA-binding domain of Phe-tRNA-synthetase-like protein